MTSRFPPDVWAYLLSRFCAATSLTLMRATVAWHVFELSRSPFYLGLIGLVQFVPAFSLLLVGGVVADRYERRRIVMLAQCVPTAGALLLAWLTAREGVTLILLYSVVFAMAAAAAFDNPARASILPNLVPPADFPRAVTLASTVQALAFATGPALSGMVIASAGISAAYGAVAAFLVVAIVSLTRVRPSWPQGAGRAVGWREMVQGVQFVSSRPVVWGCMLLDMLAVIFGGAAALLPVYANEILKVGARGYGILSASLEAGALTTSLVLMLLPPIRRAGMTLLGAVVVFGVATIVFGLSRWFPLSVAAYMLAGMADQISVIMRSTIIQLNTPDRLRGRVSAINFMFINASNQLGAVESGFVAALTSPTFSVVSGGVGCLVVVAIIAARVPALRHYVIRGHVSV
ncbi:MAG: MFS transporter [Candidatus Binatia bacterium]|nr:MAG: MFS transporter [Candidatus Binatia bacterium]